MNRWYGRVSTEQQNLDMQETMAKDLKIPKEYRYWDKKSGRNRNREGLRKCLDSLEPGDTLYVMKLDRLARSTKDLLSIVEEIEGKGCALVSLGDPLLEKDTAMGKLMLGFLSLMVEFEVNLSRERQLLGVAEAKAQGKYKGRQPKFTPAQKKMIYSAYTRGESSVADLAKWHKVSESTIRCAIREREKANEKEEK